MENTTEIPNSLRRKIDEWRGRLIDLSRRNQLLNYRKRKSSNLEFEQQSSDEIYQYMSGSGRSWKVYLPQENTLQEDEAEDAQDVKQDDSLEEKIGRKEVLPETEKSKPLSDELVSTDKSRQSIERTLMNLMRRSRREAEERDVQILFFGFGMLCWNDHGQEVQAPLLLYPVSMSRENAASPILISSEEQDLTLNPGLRIKLKKEYNIDLPVLDEIMDEPSVQKYLDYIRRKLPGRDWNIDRKTVIGLFSFEKLGMYEDLERHASLLAQNPAICSLAGIRPETDVPEESMEDIDLDKEQKPEETFQILDADSSQQQCIQKALKGRSFLLQGPPGTGKSQTIANIIAEFLARHKTVLFVSEKMAALEVVYKRLASEKLDAYCLELHSQKASKKKVLEVLSDAAANECKPDRVPSEEEYQRLSDLRQSLNEYVEALHKKRESTGCSAYESMEKVAENIRGPLLPVNVNPQSLTVSFYESCEMSVKGLAQLWPIAVAGADFPWYGYKGTHFDGRIRTEEENLLGNIQKSWENLSTLYTAYCRQLGIEYPLCWKDLKKITDLAALTDQGVVPAVQWIDNPEKEELLSKAEAYSAMAADYQSSRNDLEMTVTDGFFDIPESHINQFRDDWDMLGKDCPSMCRNENNVILYHAVWADVMKHIPDVIQDLVKYASDLSSAVNFGTSIDYIKNIDLLCNLAEHLNAEVKPEKNWMNENFFQELDEFLKSEETVCREYHEKKNALLEVYSDEFFQMNPDQLLDQIHQWNFKGVMKWINPAYKRMEKEIRHVTREFKLPEKLEEHLLILREMNQLKKQIDGHAQKRKNLFGKYDKDENTDFERLRKAVREAREILDAAGNKAVSPVFSEYLAGERVLSDNHLQSFSILKKRRQEWKEAVEKLQGAVETDHFGTAQVEVENLSLEQISRWFYGHSLPMSRFSQGLNEITSSVRGKASSVTWIQTRLEELEKLRNIEQKIHGEEDTLKNLFGPGFSGLDTTEWNHLLADIRWNAAFRNTWGNMPMTEEGKAFLTDHARRPDHISQRIMKQQNDFMELWRKLMSQFTENTPVISGTCHFPDMKMEDIHSFISRLRDHMCDLAQWVEYQSYRTKLTDLGLEDFVNKAETSIDDSQLVFPGFTRSFYEAVTDKIFEEDPCLGGFKQYEQDERIKNFKKADKNLIRESSYAIMERINRINKDVNYASNINSSEISVLRREAKKKRRQMPLKKLFTKIPNLLTRLKPCLMMSPLSVSQYIDPEQFSFDLVIFDEASQIYTEDAAVAIYRGKQLIIAGDSKQMPPTDFFRSADTDEEDYDADEEEDNSYTSSADYGSVLDECAAFLPSVSLKWHYRSRHESLIAFSNRQFYGNQLISFPSVIEHSDHLGVHFEWVKNGIYEKGTSRTNPIEAERVAQMVIQHYRAYPDKSVGVVAFSQAQMNAIQNCLEVCQKKDPSLMPYFKEDRLNGFFCKNLENVQGDERDTIILSVGYGKDRNGKMSMNFGPLNKTGGERRLNVAVTRAKEEVVVVSSIRAGDLDLKNTQSEGVKNLYQYLKFAVGGIDAISTQPGSQGEPDSPFEEDVASVIRQMGYTVVPQVGCSGYRIDMGVIAPDHPGQYILGIECDGRTYHSSATARDRDRLRQEILEGLGWTIYRIWSPNWFQKRDSEIARIKEVLKKAEKQSSQTITAVYESPHEHYGAGVSVVQRKTQEHPDHTDGTVVYEKAKMTIHSDMEDFYGIFQENNHVKELVEIIRQEGPIHKDLLRRRMLSGWGISRSGNKVNAVFDKACWKALRQGLILSKEKDFFWINPVPDHVDVRVPNIDEVDDKRKIEYIPLEEIMGAVRLIVGRAMSLSEADLIQSVVRLFGYVRATKSMQDRIRIGIHACTDQKWLSQDQEGIHAVPDILVCEGDSPSAQQ